MTFAEVKERLKRLKSRELISNSDTDLHDYMWLLEIAIRAVDECSSHVGVLIGTPDEMFCRIFQVDK